MDTTTLAYPPSLPSKPVPPPPSSYSPLPWRRILSKPTETSWRTEAPRTTPAANYFRREQCGQINRHYFAVVHVRRVVEKNPCVGIVAAYLSAAISLGLSPATSIPALTLTRDPGSCGSKTFNPIRNFRLHQNVHPKACHKQFPSRSLKASPTENIWTASFPSTKKLERGIIRREE